MLEIIKKMIKTTLITFFSVSMIGFSPDTVLSSEVTMQNAIETYRQGDYMKAVSKFKQIIEATKDREEKAISLSNLAASYYKIGRTEEAIIAWERSINILENLPDSREYLIKTILSVSQVYIDEGRIRKAVPRLLNISRAVKNPEFLQKAWGLLGSAYYAIEKFDCAIEFYEKSLSVDDKKEAPTSNRLNTLINLSKTYRQRSKQLKKEAEEVGMLKESKEVKTLHFFATSDLHKAVELAKSAVKLAGSLKISDSVSANINYLHFVDSKTEREKYLQSTVSLLNKIPNSTDKSFYLIQLAKQSQDLGQSIQLIEQAIDVAKDIEDSRTLSIAYLKIAEIYKQQKNYDKAITCNELGIWQAEIAVTSDLLFRLFWQNARIQKSLSHTKTAIASFKQALWNLRSNRAAFSIGHHGLMFALKDEVKPFLREYITLSGCSARRPARPVRDESPSRFTDFTII